VLEQAKANAATARAIIELHERLKTKLIELTALSICRATP